MPKISLIAPVYGVEKYIYQFLDSIRDQTFQDMEVILVDDGSPDNCPQILDEFAAQDKRFHVIHQKNSGVSAARNAGISLASGEYIYIVDSDDWLETEALEKLWIEVIKTNADVVYGEVFIEKTDSSLLKKTFPNAFYTVNKQSIKEIQCALNNNNNIRVNTPDFNEIRCLGGALWNAMFKRKIILENKITFNQNLRSLGEDILFWQEIYQHVKSVSYIDSPIYHYRKTDVSLSHGYKKNLFEIYSTVFEEEEKFLINNNKGKEHWDAYYFRILLYIRQSMSFYFKNIHNQCSEKERYNQFVKTINSYPYNKAIHSVSVKPLISNKQKISILLLKSGLFKVYWNLTGNH